jgi:anti-sigma-K factor RskA
MSETGPAFADDGGIDLTAAEYALGVLDGHEYAQARERVGREPAFAREVEAWEDRLAGLFDEVPGLEPAAGIWPRIERRLHGRGTVVDLDLRRRLVMWRAATGAAAAVAASLAVALIWPQQHPPIPAPAPVLAARLAGSSGLTTFVAVLDPNRHEIVLTPAAVTAPANRSPELWLIPASGKPIPLGVGAFRRPVRLSPTVALGGEGRTTLAVSIEPVGGSPTGQPTGPVVATGRLEKI